MLEAYGAKSKVRGNRAMTEQLATVTTVASLLIAIWAAVQLARNRPVNRSLSFGLIALTVMLILVAVDGIVHMSSNTYEFDAVTYLGYVLITPFLPVAALWWGRNDQSRWGSGVVVVTGLVIPVLLVRIQQVWMGM